MNTSPIRRMSSSSRNSSQTLSRSREPLGAPVGGGRPDQPPPPRSQGKKSLYGKAGYPFKSMWMDLKSRAPYYVSDWTDAWNYRVVPATLFVFFSNVLPGIAFSLDLIETTGQYGVNEVLLATFVAAAAFSIFGVQPLVISGVTGPITVFNRTIYLIFRDVAGGPDYHSFVGWTYLWAAIMHWIFAIWGGCVFLKHVTLFSCETFGFYVAWVYIQYGVQVITRQFAEPEASLFLGIILAILTLCVGHALTILSLQPYFHRHIRRFIADYGMPISVIACSGLAYWGRFHDAIDPEETRLPVQGAFGAANGRAWVVPFWQLEGKWVGVAFPFGLILFILFAFDHNVSAIMAQGPEFPLRKPTGFNWDFFVLGITTLIAGIFGFPAPNGLIPQAPLHTRSLVILGHGKKVDGENSPGPDMQEKEQEHTRPVEVPVAIVEQRVSNLLQGAACLVLMTGPFLKLLHWVPKGVLAGLFWLMGTNALAESSLTHQILFLLTERSSIKPSEPLLGVRRSRVVVWLAMELIGFAATFAITNTIAAIGFPIVIALLIPLRTYIIPRWKFFTPAELALLDGPAAGAFTMASVGGAPASM